MIDNDFARINRSFHFIHWIITNEEKKYPNFRPNQIVEEGKFTDSKRDGKWIFYYPNGKIEQIAYYNNQGLEDKTWYWFFETGDTLSIIIKYMFYMSFYINLII